MCPLFLLSVVKSLSMEFAKESIHRRKVGLHSRLSLDGASESILRPAPLSEHSSSHEVQGLS